MTLHIFDYMAAALYVIPFLMLAGHLHREIRHLFTAETTVSAPTLEAVPEREPVKVAAKAMPQPARLVIEVDDPADADIAEINSMKRDPLRRACQQAGIKWRNCYGKNKHMPTAEMRSRLLALKK